VLLDLGRIYGRLTEDAQKRDNGEGEERHQSEGAEDVAEDREEASFLGIGVVRHTGSPSRRSSPAWRIGSKRERPPVIPRAEGPKDPFLEKPGILRFAQDDNVPPLRSG